MDYAEENGFCVTFDDFCDLNDNNNNNGGSIRRSMIRKRKYGDSINNEDEEEENGDVKIYKSKNLRTERKRREKLSSRLLMLRSLMTRACIIDDAITYINKMQTQVESLTQELQEIEAKANSQLPKALDQPKTKKRDEPEEEEEEEEEMKKCGIQEQVKVAEIEVNKLWMKIIIEKKRGRIMKLIEAMNSFGIGLLDTNVTTTKGAVLITTSIQGKNGERLAAQETQELMLDIVRAI
ncbi:transcription factor DYT1-like [Neltuma alba]|uniref:transcription factor DYT1-like n=1 Tax=Neltuma alba TaxID=207710 RepID=UPI0010A59330|nr:transcription factor DYT1-like [Prosopis alba]